MAKELGPSQIVLIMDNCEIITFKELCEMFPFAKECNCWQDVMENDY